MGKHKQVACEICFKFMRSDHLKDHMKVHQKYSNKTPQSAEDIFRDQVADPKDVNSAMKRKHEVVEREAQTTIDEEALEKSALKIKK